MRQVSEVSLLLGLVILCLALSVCLVARATIVDAEENRYYISLEEGDLYLYVGPLQPENRFFLCTLERANAENKNT